MTEKNENEKDPRLGIVAGGILIIIGLYVGTMGDLAFGLWSTIVGVGIIIAQYLSEVKTLLKELRDAAQT